MCLLVVFLRLVLHAGCRNDDEGWRALKIEHNLLEEISGIKDDLRKTKDVICILTEEAHKYRLH